MAELIDAEMLILRLKAIRDFYGTNTAKDRAGRGGVVACICAVHDAQRVEAEPVRRGRWVLLPNRTAPSKLFRCSECGNVTEHKHFSRNGYYSFCKDCGARMDGDCE